jgi:pyruvate,water dikinase
MPAARGEVRGSGVRVVSPQHTVAFDSSAGSGTSRLGGKCAALAAMTRAGAPVPTGFVVTTDAFEALFDRGGLRGPSMSPSTG